MVKLTTKCLPNPSKVIKHKIWVFLLNVTNIYILIILIDSFNVYDIFSMEFYWDHTQQLKAKSSIKCEKKISTYSELLWQRIKMVGN